MAYPYRTQVPYKRYRVTPQKITHAGRFVVPSDASSLALLLAASALNGGSITINAHMGTLPQGDEAFIDMLEAMGAIIEISDAAVMDGSGKPRDTDAAKKDTAGVLGAGETIRVRVGSMGLGGGRFDLGNYPDLLPPLAIMALRCSEPIEIFNVGHARLKETDPHSHTCKGASKAWHMRTRRDKGRVHNMWYGRRRMQGCRDALKIPRHAARCA